MLLFQFTRGALVFSLLIRELVQQFPRRQIRRPARRSRVKSARFQLHQFRLLPGDLHAQRPDQPHRFPGQESLHVFPPDQRNMIAEPLPEHRKQTVAMAYLFLSHFFEHFRGRGILVAQRVRKLTVNPPVFFFGGNRDRQNLLFRQVFKFFQHRSLPSDSSEHKESHKLSREVIFRHNHDKLTALAGFGGG